MTELFTFAKFMPGTSLGYVSLTLGAEFLALWERIYPWDALTDGNLPVGASTVVLMHAWRTVVDPKPPGNVHAGQRVEMHAALRVGERIDTEVKCVSKEERKGRLFVLLTTTSNGEDGRLLFTSHTNLIWAQ